LFDKKIVASRAQRSTKRSEVLRCRPGTAKGSEPRTIPDQRCTARACALTLHRIRDTAATNMKLLRTIRLDPSDTFIFERAAGPGEWAVSGAFVFANDDPAKLEGKTRAAFRSGFLGVDSLGWSTLVQVVEASDEDRVAIIEMLARQLLEKFGAPDLASARAAAKEEVAFAAALCDHPHDTLIAVHRSHDGGEIRETFRTLRPKAGPKPLRAFAFLDVEGDEEPAERVDLAALAKPQKAEE
jgi:hypothetical protein